MAFKTIELTGFAANSPLAAELARALKASGVQVVNSTLEAVHAASAASVPDSHVVFEALADARDTIAASTTIYGQVRDMTARTSLRFQVKRGDGSVLMPPNVIAMTLDLTYNEQVALAKQEETMAVQQAMQTDIVSQVLRRLSAIRPEQLLAAPASTTPSASSVMPAASQPRNGHVPSPQRPPAGSAL